MFKSLNSPSVASAPSLSAPPCSLGPQKVKCSESQEAALGVCTETPIPAVQVWAELTPEHCLLFPGCEFQEMSFPSGHALTCQVLRIRKGHEEAPCKAHPPRATQTLEHRLNEWSQTVRHLPNGSSLLLLGASQLATERKGPTLSAAPSTPAEAGEPAQVVPASIRAHLDPKDAAGLSPPFHGGVGRQCCHLCCQRNPHFVSLLQP